MSDMFGILTSCSFRVKDLAAFRRWFERYSFGRSVELHADAQGYVSFCGDESSAYPRAVNDDGDLDDVPDLAAFARELCEHLEDGELVNIVACGHEKYRYAYYDQLVIAKAFPDKPLYRSSTSDMDYEGCLRQIAADAAQSAPATVFVAIRGGCYDGASSTNPNLRVIIEDFDNPDLDGKTQPYEDGVGELDAATLADLQRRCADY